MAFVSWHLFMLPWLISIAISDDSKCTTRISKQLSAPVGCEAGETLVSCGFKNPNSMANDPNINFYEAVNDVCVPIQGLYAHARCCQSPTFINCKTVTLDTLLGISPPTCPTEYPHFLNCLDYPSIPPLPCKKAVCCQSDDHIIDCTPQSTDFPSKKATISCQDGYFMADCKPCWVKPAKAWYIGNGTCTVERKEDNLSFDVDACASCCRISTNPPTTFPATNPEPIQKYILAASSACYDAEKYRTDCSFHPPYDGQIVGVKLQHISGYVTCTTGAPKTNWGCKGDGVLRVSMIETDVGTVYPTDTTTGITNVEKSSCSKNRGLCTIRKYELAGINDKDSEILEWIDLNHPITVKRSQNFSLQYEEGCCDKYADKNEGVGYADVYFIYTAIEEPTPPPSPSPTPNSGHLIVDGNPRNIHFYPPQLNPECTSDYSKTAIAENPFGNHDIGVTCCESMTGTIGNRDGCKQGLNYFDAEKHCKDNEHVLCSIDQIKAGAGAEKGCSFDAFHVWTRTECSPLGQLTDPPTTMPTSNPIFDSTQSTPSSPPSSTPTTKLPTTTTTRAPSSNPTSVPTTNPTLAPSQSPTVALILVQQNAECFEDFKRFGVVKDLNTCAKTILSNDQCTGNQFMYSDEGCSCCAPNLSQCCVPIDGWSVYEFVTVEPTTSPTPSVVPTTTTFDPTPAPTPSPTSLPTINPTSKPTSRPSFDPTEYPLQDPSPSPTPSPSPDPTPSPTPSPTDDPTSDPTTGRPTIDPTADPTNDPTQDPTSDPTTFDPTSDPTDDPTIDPTADPTNDPSRDPTSVPTVDPTIDPTADPTADPTQDPTVNPTNAPTTSPSNAPSFAPSYSPTSGPTRFPTNIDAYSAFINVVYSLQGLTESDVLQICEDVAESTESMEHMLEVSYVNHVDAFQLHFREFYVRINELNGHKSADLLDAARPDIIISRDCVNNNLCSLEMNSQIFCVENVCDFIVLRYQQALFEAEMTEKFKYFLNTSPNAEINGNIQFKVLRMDGVSQEKVKSNSVSITSFDVRKYFWIFIVFGVFLFCAIFYCKWRKPLNERAQKASVVSNAMVVSITIGDYEKKPQKEPGYELDENVFDEPLDSLPGIEYDIKNLTKLFKNRYNFDVFPVLRENEPIRVKWSHSQLKSYLENRAKYLSENIEKGQKYDGLILTISGHAIPQYIITSDYKKFSRIAFHRIFSFYGNVRQIPRFVLYDCEKGKYKDNKSKDEDSLPSLAEGIIEPAHDHQGTAGSICLPEEDPFGGYTDRKMRQPNMPHPEARLCRVIGAVTNVRQYRGSLITHKMCKLFNEYLDTGKQKYIHEVFDSMQSEFGRFHSRPECMWTHDTRYMVFKKCRKNKSKDQMVQIALDSIVLDDEEETKVEVDLYDNDEISLAQPQESMMSDIQMLEIMLSVDDDDPDKEGNASTGDIPEAYVQYANGVKQ